MIYTAGSGEGHDGNRFASEEAGRQETSSPGRGEDVLTQKGQLTATWLGAGLASPITLG